MTGRETLAGYFHPKRLRLAARILSGAIIAFTLVMLIGHVFFPEPTVEDYPPIENLLPVIMLISVLCLAGAWRWELWGGRAESYLFPPSPRFVLDHSWKFLPPIHAHDILSFAAHRGTVFLSWSIGNERIIDIVKSLSNTTDL